MSNLSSAVVCPTFEAYRAARDAGDTKEARRLLGGLVQSYDGIVARHARRLARGDFEDLVQAGRMAVADAFEAYDPTREIAGLRGLAEMKILTAMQRSVVSQRDQVSSAARWTPMPQATRRAVEAFTAKHGRAPVAADMGVDEAAFESWTSQDTYAPYTEEHEDGEAASVDAAVKAATFSVPCEDRELCEALWNLPVRSARIFVAIAVQGETQASVARREGIDQSNVCRAYESAIQAIKKHLA